MSKDELSLLLFLETRAVDHGGKVQTAHMNAGDFEIAKKWNKKGFILFGRVRHRDITQGGSHWCQLSEAAWEAAHAERKTRAARSAEFNFAEMLEGDTDRIVEYPWCLEK